MTFTSIPASLKPVVEDVYDKLHSEEFYNMDWDSDTSGVEQLLIAFLNACVERGVGQYTTPNPIFKGVTHPPVCVWRLPAIVLNLGATDDKA